MIKLAKRLGIEPQLIHSLENVSAERISTLADKCTEKGFHILRKENYITRLAVILTLAVRVKARYDEEGVD